MDWAGIDTWPNAAYSRRIEGPSHRWHVQEAGAGPLVLLLHGAGASTHSWRDILPLLAQDHRVVALDLPGHGFTQLGARQRSSLERMTEDLGHLIAQENWRPDLIAGHSAGGAIALNLARTIPTKVIGINAALGEFPGLAGLLFPAMARLMAMTPFVSTMFAGAAKRPGRADTLLESTGSRIDPEGVALYQRLIADRAHVDGALQMMAQWTLKPLLKTLPHLQAEVLLVAASGDRTVPPGISEKVARDLPNGQFLQIDGLGHLAHEENPRHFAELIRNTLSG